MNHGVCELRDFESLIPSVLAQHDFKVSISKPPINQLIRDEFLLHWTTVSREGEAPDVAQSIVEKHAV
jgi:hypothetical protein